MRAVNQRGALFFAVLLSAFTAMTWGSASAQVGETVRTIGPNERIVALVRQDESDCTNSTVSDKNPSLFGGTVWVIKGSDGNTTVNVGITAKPNTKYNFFLKCKRQLGAIQTGEEGVGAAVFPFSTNEVGDTYGFDMYPDGAPSGNKFQSVQVKY